MSRPNWSSGQVSGWGVDRGLGSDQYRAKTGATAYYQHLPGTSGGTVRDITLAVTADNGYYFPIRVDRPWTPTEFAIRVNTGVAGAFGYLWIYQSDVDEQPIGPAVLDVTAAGGFSMATGGYKSISGFSLTFQPGLYVAIFRPTATTQIVGNFCPSFYYNIESTVWWITRSRPSVTSTTAPLNPDPWTAMNSGSNNDFQGIFWR